MCEALDDSTDHHYAAPTKDGPSSSESIVDNANEWETEDGTKRVGRGDDTFQRSLRIIEELLPAGYDLKRIDELRVEARSKLDPHTCWKEHEVEIAEITFAEPRDFVLLSDACEDRVGGTDLTRLEIQYLGSHRLLVISIRVRTVDRVPLILV